MNKLAINGGQPVRTKLFPEYNTIGEPEKIAVEKVLHSGNLSQYIGGDHEDFYGGPKVREFEELWAVTFGSEYAVSVNSNTSGLYAAMGAIGVQPGDEVIVSPYTMSASAVAPLIYGGIPVFADICPDTYCMSPDSIESCITQRTKAIIVVHIFGQPAEMEKIMELARAHGIYVIEDCAQAPMAKYKGRNVGTIGDLGVFSLNYHKHIHTGEGGIIIGNDIDLIEKCRYIRNHAENLMAPRGVKDLTNMIGYNFRMTEIEAAIGIEQVKKLPNLIAERRLNVSYLEESLLKLSGFSMPGNRNNLTGLNCSCQGIDCTLNCTNHVYYVHAIKFNEDLLGVKRDVFIEAIRKELPSAILRETTQLIGCGYVLPIYLQPLFQQKAAWAFEHPKNNQPVNYSKGICPVAERMHFHELFTHEFIRPGLSKEDLDDVLRAFHKVYQNRNELKS